MKLAYGREPSCLNFFLKVDINQDLGLPKSLLICHGLQVKAY